MQEDFRLIVDLVLVFAVAACGGLLAALLKQPVLLGYTIGGMVVGPSGLRLIKELVQVDRKSKRLYFSHLVILYDVFCLK